MPTHRLAFRHPESGVRGRAAIPRLPTLRLALCVALLFAGPLTSATAATGYAHRAPLSQYLSKSKAAEIAFARTAAPAALTGKADILTLGPHGYDVAVHGTDGFVCLVERSWAHDFKSAQFWNPHHQAPVCYNPAAARSVLPTYLTRTEWVLAGLSTSTMAKRTDAAVGARKITPPAVGATS